MKGSSLDNYHFKPALFSVPCLNDNCQDLTPFSYTGTSRQANAEITPEMIDAGCVVLRANIHEEVHHDFPEIVTKVFAAMKDAELVAGQKGEPSRTDEFPDR